MKQLLTIIALAAYSFAGTITNAEIVTAPTVSLLNEKLAKMVTDYIVTTVSEPQVINNEVAVTITLGTPPGISSAMIVYGATIPVLNTELSRLTADYVVTSISSPVLIPTQQITPSTKPTTANTVKQIGVTVTTGKP